MFKGGKSADQNVLMVLAALRRIQREGDGSNSFAIFHSDKEKNYYIQFLGQCGELCAPSFQIPAFRWNPGCKSSSAS
jgi:hypothetical protein